MRTWISRSCDGERCNYRTTLITSDDMMTHSPITCGRPAAHKVEEVIFSDDPMQPRHPLTAYLCEAHYDAVMGSMADHVRQLQLATLDPPSI